MDIVDMLVQTALGAILGRAAVIVTDKYFLSMGSALVNLQIFS